ncbi:cytosolic sulfotransferase 12-like isoform X2 [Solanum stenotomum]|uniref:cytosolic sulfotransferase 12-like isoform X2 n=1 Tax=Solanum stenotomum TaxID=172797 RepID=UPI0020D1561A|nr:cytosolic sulfotransferase 12-like isoform X2 [Solanum stenotomum]
MSKSQTSPQIPPKYLQEDEISDECKKLLLTLPKERGWLASHIYNYQGFWVTPRFIQGVIACQQQFQAQDSDIILVTTPKSGTTWLKSLLFVLVNRMKYPVFEQNHPLLVKNPHDLIPFLEIKLYVDDLVPNFASVISPRLLSTHMPFASLPKSVQDSKTKLVYLCRNPKDTFISLWHFTNNLRLHHKDIHPIEEKFESFCKGVSLYGPFWNHVLDYWKQSIEKPNKVLFLMYEEIKVQPKLQLKRLAEFLECPFSIEEKNCGVMDEILRMCSFENLSNLEVNANGKLSTGEENNAFFRKGEVGDWKNYFTIEMSEKLNHIIEQKFQGSGIKFSYI